MEKIGKRVVEIGLGTTNPQIHKNWNMNDLGNKVDEIVKWINEHERAFDPTKPITTKE